MHGGVADAQDLFSHLRLKAVDEQSIGHLRPVLMPILNTSCYLDITISSQENIEFSLPS